MIYRTLGRTGLRVSAVAFGAGPVSGLMTGTDAAAQLATVRAGDRGRHQLVRHRPGLRATGSRKRTSAACWPNSARRDRFTSPRRCASRRTPSSDIGEYVRESVEESLQPAARAAGRAAATAQRHHPRPRRRAGVDHARRRARARRRPRRLRRLRDDGTGAAPRADRHRPPGRDARGDRGPASSTRSRCRTTC